MPDLDIYNDVDPGSVPAPKPSLDEMWQGTVQSHDELIKESNLGKSTHFEGKGKLTESVDRYVTYGTETFGKLGFDPYVDNSARYNANTHWSADTFRAMSGYSNLAGIGRTDTFGGGLFAETDSHKAFKKSMDDYGSTRGGAAGFWSNTLLSAGYTVGIIQAIAAEEAILLVTTGGLGNIGTAGEIGRGVSNIWKAWDRGSKVRNVVAASIKFGKKIENARLLKAPIAFAKQLNPIGESARFIKNYSKIKGLNSWQRSFQGAASLARDARKIHMTMAESNLEASLAMDETREKLYDEWFADNPGQDIGNEDRLDIQRKSDEVFNIAYGANVGLIYVTNAITFGTMFRSMSLTNKAFGLMQAGKLTMKSIGKNVTFKAVKQGLTAAAKNKISRVTWGSSALWATRSSMEGVQEIGQDFISGYAKRYVVGDERLRGHSYNSMLGAMGDMKFESFASGFLMGTIAAPTSFSIKQAQNFVLHGGHKSVTDRAQWKEKRTEDYESRVKDAEFLTEFFNATGSWLDVQGDGAFRATEAQEKMVQAGEDNDRMAFEDGRAEIFRIGMKKVMKNGLEKEMIGHLEGLKEHTVEELNESLDRTDITEDNIGEFKEKIDAKIQAVKEFKKNFDEAQDEVNPIDANKLDPKDPDFDAKRIAYLAFENYRDELIFSKDAVRDLAVRLDGMSKVITKDGVISSTELKTILDNSSLAREIITLQADIASNKEYDIAPADQKYKEEKLNALKSYQKALIKFDKLKEDASPASIDLVHAEMSKAFGDIINANLEVESDTSQRVLNDKKFSTFWDYLIKSRERVALQKHANMMLDPNLAVEYMERSKEVLAGMEKDKGEYILKSLNALLEYEVGTQMVEDLAKAGYVFSWKEMDDLIQKGIMPSKLFNIKTNKELNNKEAKEAQAIIESHTRRLKNKHVFATGTGYTTRKKTKSDKRKSAWFYRTFGKKDTPVKISTFINSLLNSPHITNSEKEILNVLKDLDVANGEVILTESADAPVSIEKDGTIKIDVRFSSEDFRNSKTPFEYIATSALLQAHYTKQLKEDPALKQATIALMKKAREAYIVKMEHETSANIAMFKDPVHFLSEALNNEAFQTFLSTVEDVEDVEDIKAKSLWESFTDILKKTFGKFFEGSLLNRAVKLSQLALTDEALELTLEGEIEEEEEEVELSGEKKERAEQLEVEIKEVEAKIKEVKDAKGSARLFLGKKKKLDKLAIELRQLKDELKNLPKKEVVKKSEVIVEEELKEELDSEGNVVIGKKTPFKSLPEDLQEDIASLYLDSIDHMAVKKKGTPETEAKPDVMRGAQNDFDNPITEETLPQDSAVNRLTKVDLVNIKAEMLTNPLYHAVLLKYNSKRLHSDEPSAEVEEEVVDVKERNALIERTKTEADLEILLPGSTSVFTQQEVESLVNRMNTRETVEALGEFLKSVQETMNARAAEPSSFTEDVDLNAKFTLAGVSELIPYLTKVGYSESDLENIIEMLNDDSAKFEEVYMAVAEKRIDEKKAYQVRLENWRANLRTLDELASGKQFRVVQGNKQYVEKLTKADVILFKEQHDEVVRSSTAQEFQEALARFRLQTDSKAASIRQMGLGFVNDENLQDNVRDLIQQIKSTGLLSSIVVARINGHLKDMNVPYHVQNIGRRGAISYALIHTKKTLKIDATDSVSKTLSDFYGVDGMGGPIDFYQAMYMVYEWLQNNKVHPSLPGEKRSYQSKKSPDKTFDGIAHKIFDGVVDEENLERDFNGSPNLTEEIINMYTDLAFFRADLIENMEEVKEKEADLYDDGATESQLREEFIENERTKFYGTKAFLILSGYFEGNLENLTEGERELYRSTATAYIDEVLTPVEAEILAINDDVFSNKRQDKSLERYTDWVINRIQQKDVALQEIVALHRIITKGKANLANNQSAEIMKVIHSRITEGDFVYSTILAGKDILRVMPGSNVKNIEFFNVETEKTIVVPIHEALTMIDEVIESGTEYLKNNADTDINEEDSGTLKQAYSDIFVNLAETISEVEDMEPEVLKASIIEELNRCK